MQITQTTDEGFPNLTLQLNCSEASLFASALRDSAEAIRSSLANPAVERAPGEFDALRDLADDLDRRAGLMQTESAKLTRRLIAYCDSL